MYENYENENLDNLLNEGNELLEEMDNFNEDMELLNEEINLEEINEEMELMNEDLELENMNEEYEYMEESSRARRKELTHLKAKYGVEKDPERKYSMEAVKSKLYDPRPKTKKPGFGGHAVGSDNGENEGSHRIEFNRGNTKKLSPNEMKRMEEKAEGHPFAGKKAAENWKKAKYVFGAKNAKDMYNIKKRMEEVTGKELKN